MATSPNFSWPEPDNSDLVKNGALAIRTAVDAIDSSMGDLKGGTTGQVLSKASNTDMDFTWVAQDDSNAIQNAIVDAKGDLIAASAADTPARLPVGSNFAFLQADSSTATGLVWNNANWTAYTPTVTAVSGSFTTVSAAAEYARIGKVCTVHFIITITTNGTAGAGILMTLPFTGGSNCQGVWREISATGSCGIVSDNATNAVLRTFTNTYPGASGYIFSGSLTYEVA
jgi:hypothetical protein